MNLNTVKLPRYDKESLLQYTKHFIRKAVQIIVQSRLGEKKPTKSRIHANNSDWFNLSIKDLAQIIQMTKSTFGSAETIINLGSPFCIEISLKTPENQTMILETWCILFNEQLCDSTQVICYNVYKKMSLVLRSLLCMTRSMPTYQLSRRQSPDTYVLLYRMYLGEPVVHNLGEKYATAKAGTIGTPIGSIIINVAYRTRLTMTPQTSNFDAIYFDENHFVNAQSSPTSSSNNNSNTNKEEYNNYSSMPLSSLNENKKNSSQPIKMKPKKNNDDTIGESPSKQNDDSSEDCSRNSSIASTPSDTMYYFKLKSAAFAPSSLNATKDLTSTSQINDVPPFISLLCNEISPSLTGANSDNKKTPPHNIDNKKQNLTGDELSDRKQNRLILQPKQDDFVMIETQKIAFGLSDASNDLSTFFRSCENAPILESFNSEPSLIDTLKDLDQQLLTYESKVAEFDDLVKSLEPN